MIIIINNVFDVRLWGWGGNINIRVCPRVDRAGVAIKWLRGKPLIRPRAAWSVIFLPRSFHRCGCVGQFFFVFIYRRNFIRISPQTLEDDY